jgi:GNAT superfamily N-acetyltransferase
MISVRTQPVPQPPREQPRWSETLRDRSHVVIRPIQPQDRAAEKAFLEGLSLQARRYRFLGQFSSPGELLIDRLVHVDFEHDVAFVAVVPDDARERIVGVARYGVDPDGTRCECAVTVADAWQKKGLGTILMRHLIEIARARGIGTMYSIDSTDNVEMHDLAGHLGFATVLDPEDPHQYIHSLELQPPEPAT